MAILWISCGAILGALGRWGLGLWLNPWLSQFAFGTLITNWLGCFLIGVAMGINLQDNHKLLLITGFLGSFTTFSSFSAELADKLLSEKYLSALTVLSLHLFGGVLLTLLGVWLTRVYLNN